MTSLRDMGYSFEAAVADLVDNSIDAGATCIEVDIAFDGSDSWLRVSDDGHGMSRADLEEALRYGSRRAYAARDLGRYGLGLKTASLSQCRRLTVASRVAPERARIHVRRWDLDHVAAVDAWELLELNPRECDYRLLEALWEGPGTVVLWERLDRVLAYQRPDGASAARGLSARITAVREHLEMVFHRFLAGEANRTGQLAISVNGEQLTAWDPFCRDEPETRALTPQNLGAGDATDQSVIVRPYILPVQARFSSPQAHARAGGPRRWNRQQGLYIYMRDRLIQSGSWARLRAEDEHTKLARIAVDIPRGAEDSFEINVSKMRVGLPEPLRGPLQALASGVAAMARETYQGRHDIGRVEPGGDTEEIDYLLVSDDRLTVEVVATVLLTELEEHPTLLRRILERLGLEILNERPADTVDVTPASRAS
jgi:hypothetical protein